MSPATSSRAAAPPDASYPSPQAVAGRLALQLWLASILCWWVVGIQFSRLWWLVNEKQLGWILFCYAWEVPAIGWTGVVLVPWLRLRRLLASAARGDRDTGRELARFPEFVFWMVVGTSTAGYAVGALQVRHFAALPMLEVVKILIQGPALGGLFAVAAYLMAERALQDLPAAQRTEHASPGGVLAGSLYGKVLSITVALTLGVAVPIVLHTLSQSQRHREELRGRALADALREGSSDSDLPGALAAMWVSIAVSGGLLAWRGVGPVALTLLFVAGLVGTWAILRFRRHLERRSPDSRQR